MIKYTTSFRREVSCHSTFDKIVVGWLVRLIMDRNGGMCFVETLDGGTFGLVTLMGVGGVDLYWWCAGIMNVEAL